MAAISLEASLEMLQPLCCRCMLCLQGDLCCCLHKWSPQALQCTVMLSAHNVLQKSPQFIFQSFEVCTPRKPILGADEGQKVPPQPYPRYLAILAGTDFCWKTHSWPLMRDILRCFTAPCRTSSLYTFTPVSLLSWKNEDVSHLNL